MLLQLSLYQLKLASLRTIDCDKVRAEAESFAEAHNVEVEIACPHRATRIPARFQDGVALTTTGSRDVDNIEPKQYCKTQLYFPVLDKMLVEFNSCFSDFNKSIMKAVQATSPISPNSLQFPTLLNHELEEDILNLSKQRN